MWQKYIFLSVPFSSTMLCLTVVATCCFSTQGESWRSQAIHWQEISTSHPNLTSCWWISQTEEFASACESFSYRMTRRCYHSPPPLPSHPSVCRWPKKLAEQVSPRRPQLPGGSQLRFCAHRPLLRTDGAAGVMLLNVKPCGMKWRRWIHIHSHRCTPNTHTHTLHDGVWRRPSQCCLLRPWMKARHWWSLQAVL